MVLSHGSCVPDCLTAQFSQSSLQGQHAGMKSSDKRPFEHRWLVISSLQHQGILDIASNNMGKPAKWNGDERHLLLPGSDIKDHKSGSYEGRCYVPARYVLTFLAFLGFFNVYCLRANLSVALVAMVNSTSEENSTVVEECPESSGSNSTSTSSTTGEFDWDEKTQGIILGAFFYGYIVTQLPGGWLAERIGGKRLFGYGVLCTALLTLVTPVAARSGIPMLVAVRVLEGIGEAVTFPAMHAMWGVWAPVYERSKLVSFSCGGAQLGTVFALPISGILCQQGFAGGWPSVFYVFGALGCLWFVAWMLLVSETPATHPRISDSERRFIESNIGPKRENLDVPWKKIFTSRALWGTVAGHVAFNWGIYSTLTCLPTYMKKILHFEIQQDGFLSALPYLLLWFVQMFSGYFADYLRSKGHLSTVATRKIFNTIGCTFPMGLLIATGYAGCDHTLSVVLLTLAVGLSGFCIAGFNCNHLDIAPKYAGILMGITNTFATIPGFVGPAVVGILTNNNQTSGQWRIFFFITAGIYVVGATLFCLLAEGEEQEWARTPPSVSATLTQEQEVTPPNAVYPHLQETKDVPHHS
ncbi:sialin-like isoform X2 [Pomacea canaliculata]|uniref:sialin-like isoform X2 n=2 Tax=Pomacea canaliculata TaxID=400727 RepID=UPI000D725E8E|nr:sialin-like isoform X2 [Pomacea canaliculata]